MTLFDDFIANNASEDQMWQMITDHDLFDSQGYIDDCALRDCANKLIQKHPQLAVNITYVMNKLYLACCKHFAFKYKKESAKYRSAITA